MRFIPLWMAKEIFLPEYAKDQLEQVHPTRKWYDSIPYKDKATEGFTLKIHIEDDEMGFDPLEDGEFHPERHEDIYNIIERMETVEVIPEEKRVYSVDERKNLVYRCFTDGGDGQTWARYDGENIEILLQQTFTFMGFGGVHPYHKRQEEVLDTILEEGAGIYLNRKELRLCDGSYDSYNSFPQKDPKFAYTDEDKPSDDGKTYKLFQDYDDGARGWAILTVKPKKRVKVLSEDHNDNVREYISDEFLGEVGLNFKSLRRWNCEDASKYQPTVEDFTSDFHRDEDGKKEAA